MTATRLKIKASLRGIDTLLSHKMKVKVLLLPDEDDPDSFARVNTPEKFREYVKAHETDIIRFKTQVMMQDAADDPLKRSDAIRSVVESLACIPDPITAKVYIQECARLMNVDEETISTETQRMRVKVLERIRSERRHESEKSALTLNSGRKKLRTHCQNTNGLPTTTYKKRPRTCRKTRIKALPA